MHAAETVGALREGEGEPSSPLLAPRREQNLPGHAGRAPIASGEGGQGAHDGQGAAPGGRGWRVVGRSGGRAAQGGLAGGSTERERGGREASEANGSLAPPGAGAFPRGQPVLWVPRPHPGSARSSSPSVPDLFVAQNQFDL